MEIHHFWAFFVIALIAGGAITLAVSNATMTGYAVHAQIEQKSFFARIFGIQQAKEVIKEKEIPAAPEVTPIAFEQPIPAGCGKCGGCCVNVPAPISEEEKVLLLNYLVLTGEIEKETGEGLTAFSFGSRYCDRCQAGKKGTWCGLCSAREKRDKAIEELLAE